MQVADLIQKDRAVDDTRSIDLIKLLNRVVFIEVKAEHRVQLFAVSS